MSDKVNWDEFTPVGQPAAKSPAVDWSGFEVQKPSGFIRKAVGDKVLGFASGAVGATKALADAVGAGNVVSDTLESANTGINDYLSPEEKASQQARSTRTEQAKGTGAWNEFKAGAQNFAESPIQQTITGAGSIVPVALAALGGLPVAAATGVGMGVGTVKGRIYDDTKKRGIDAGLSETDAEAQATKAQDYTGENSDQIALGGALGAADALTGVGRIAGGALRNAIMKPAVSALPQAVERGMLGRAAMGALGEVPLEVAQGGQEQLATNIAAQRQGVNTGTWDGVVGQATEEGLASLGMGAGVGALHSGAKAPSAPVPTAETPSSPAPLQLGNTPDPYLSFADGTVGRRSEVDAYINALPADQQPAARAKIMGLAPQPVEPSPVKPSEAMGLNAAAGPLSAAAVVAVDTGAHQPAFDAAAAQATYRAETEALRQQQEAQDAAELEQAQRDEQDQAAAKAQAETKAMLDQATAPVDMTADELFPAPAAPAKPEGSFITKAKQAKAQSTPQGESNGATDTPTGMAQGTNEPASSQPIGSGISTLVQRDASGDGSGRVPAGADGQSAASRPMVDAGRSEAPVAPSGNSSTQEPVAVAKKEPENQPLALEPLAQAATETVAKPVTQPAQPVMGEGAGGSQPTQVAPPKFTLDTLQWDADRLSSTYSMEQLNTLHGEVQAQFSNKTVSGSPVDERGMATEERLNADGQKMESALKKAIGVVYEKSKGAAPPKPKTASKADLDHLFGVDQKRAKAVERIAKGTAYFSLPMKAQEFIAKNGLKETHQSVKTSRGWDVVAKDSQPKGNTSVTKTTEAITPAAQQQAPKRGTGSEVTTDPVRNAQTANAQDTQPETYKGHSIYSPVDGGFMARDLVGKAFGDFVAGPFKTKDEARAAVDRRETNATAKTPIAVAQKPEIVVDKAEMRPYRKPDGSVGYEAVPIQNEAPTVPTGPRVVVNKLGADGLTDAERSSGKPSYADKPAAKADPLTEKEKAAKAKMFGALGKLAALASKNTRMNWTPEEEQQLLPIVIELFDGAMELGSVTFQKAVRYVREFIANGIDQETADAIPFETLQGAYIHTARKFKDQGATTGKEVMSFDSLAELEKPGEQAEPSGDKPTLSASLLQAIRQGDMPKDNPALKKLVEAFGGKPADQARMKEAQEQLEVAIVMAAREVVGKHEGDKSTFETLVRLYESQPNLNIRTSTSIANQAYSTPAPLAYLASQLAGITKATVVMEPTAGTGMLLIGANPAKAVVNELNDLRVALLTEQGFKPSQKDAAADELTDKEVDAVITNPPFGSVKGDDGKPVKIKVDNYDIGQIDHLIAARALSKMKEDGKAVLIIGANKVTGGLSTDDRIFFNWLYAHYNVTGHFEVNGDLYARQGAGWPVRVIAINGRQKSNKFSPVAGTIQRADNWSQVYEQYKQILGAIGKPIAGAGVRVGGSSDIKAGPTSVPTSAGSKIPNNGQPGPAGSTGSAGNVAGASAGVVSDRPKPDAGTVGPISDEQRLNGKSSQSSGLEPSGSGAKPAKSGSEKPAGADALTPAGNEFQSPYTPRSSRKDEGVLIPANMAQPTQDALSQLEDEVGDIDEFSRKELGYKSVADLHNALMGLQVDSVAMAIRQIQKGKAVVIADQTGIGKGRQAAAIIRWAAKSGLTPVFVSVKPSLFTDMYGDLADIGTNDVNPFIMNSDAWVAGEDGSKLFANKPVGHKATLESISATGTLPEGSNAMFMTYSQINVANVQRQALMALAPNAVFILDESHNAAGASATGQFMIDTLGLAKGVTYLSATYAKRPDNMPLYFKTDIGDAAADTTGLAVAMASGGLPLQTVVSNNLVKAGQMFRRERSYDGVSIASTFDTPNRALHERMSNEATSALRAIVSADRMFHSVYVKQLAEDLASQGATVKDNAGNQASAGVQHTEFSSVVHNFVKQMLLGLKAQTAADEAIASLKRGEKPIIAVENTMGSFLNEYAASNGIAQGDSLGSFDYRTVLSRALDRTRVITEKAATGEEAKRPVPLSELDAATRMAYDRAQKVIDGLVLNIPVSPIDWMRAEIIRAGFSVAEITGRNLSVDYSNTKKPTLTAIDLSEQKNKVNTTRQFNSGKLDALVLNVAGSTGISLHASEKFEDQRQRHMIVAQAAGDINIFMQMLGRVHRTGQVKLPKYTILSVDLPTEKRPTAVLSVKMKSLNANTSSNTESATSVKSSDILNKYGDQIVQQYLVDNYELARALGVEQEIGGDTVQDDLARKVTGRLALQPIETQHTFYDEVESQYSALIDYLNKTNQNDLEPRTFDFDAKEARQEVLFDGPNKETPFGEDAIYGEYSIKAQGTPMKPEEIKALMTEHLGSKTGQEHANDLVESMLQTFTDQMNAGREKHGLVPGKFDEAKYRAFMVSVYGEDNAEQFVSRAKAAIAAGGQVEAIAKEVMRSVAGNAVGMEFIRSHPIGSTFRVDINSEPFNAVVTNIHSTHKSTGNPFSLSKIQLTVAVNGALRSLNVPATQLRKIEVSNIAPFFRIEQLFKEQPPNQRETAKIVTGNLLAAYGEIKGTRGTIITFTKQDGTNEQGILLPKLFDFSKNTQGDFRLPTGADALKFLQKSENKDIGRFGIMSRDGIVRVLPVGQGVRVQVPKSKLKGGKYFLDKGLISAGGDFVSSGSFMVATVYEPDAAVNILDLLMKKQALYTLPSMTEEAKEMVGQKSEHMAPVQFARSKRPTFSRGAQTQATESVETLVNAIVANWSNAPEIIVAFDMQDARIPERVRQEDLKQRSGGAAGTPEGFYYKGKVYLMSSQLSTANDVARVLFHETLGHYGLRGHFGGALKPILQQIVTMRQDAVNAKMQEYGLRSVSNMDRMTAAEEVLAEMAQNTPELGFVKRAIAAIRNWLRANVPGFSNMKLMDEDIISNFLIPARRYVTNNILPDARRGAGFTASNDKAEADKLISDSARSDAEMLANLTRSKSFIEKGFGGLDAPTKRGVELAVIRLAKNPKVFDSIVNLVPVNVVNMLGVEKITPDMLLNNPSVFENLLVINRNESVSVRGNAATQFVLATAMAAAKHVGIDLRLNLASWSPAKRAGEENTPSFYERTSTRNTTAISEFGAFGKVGGGNVEVGTTKGAFNGGQGSLQGSYDIIQPARAFVEKGAPKAGKSNAMLESIAKRESNLLDLLACLA